MLSWKTLRLPLVLSMGWCLLIVVLAKRAIDVRDAHTCELALIQTRTLYAQIVDTRAWNAEHGGVYVRESAYGAPNPWIPEEQRSLEGRDGTRLVLINPAYMSRQIGELSRAHGASFRITSLEPLRPENRADMWETEALRRCAGGASEVFSLEGGEDSPQYRFMAPLHTKSVCLPCHQANREGDLRGGISVSLNAAPFLHAAGDNKQSLAFAYAFMGLTGVVGIGGATLIINRRRVLAEEANRMKSAFLANMSHDMRTPLTGILGMVEMLADCGDAGERRRACGYLRESARTLLEMVTDVTDYAVLDAGQLRLQPHVFAVRPALARCLELFHPACAAKGLALHMNVAPDVPEWLRGDDFRLRQALGNLVGNAIKFTESGYVSVRVTAVAPESGGKSSILLHCTVRDTGPGVSPEDREKIFERFERGCAARESAGTGLGLAIAREIARRMGGDILLEDAAGASASFVLTARLERSRAPEDAADHEGPGAALPAGDGRVLLAEDNAVNAYFFRRVLSEAGYQVTVAADGSSVLRSLREQPVDVVLLDLRMPAPDGLEVARRIRQGEAEVPVDLPIIALTASLYEEEQRALTRLDITERLLKPIRPETLLRSVARGLRRCDPDGVIDIHTSAGGEARAGARAAGERAAYPEKAAREEGNVFDRAAALDGLDGEEELLHRLCAMFRQELPAQVRAVRAATESGERRRLAHAVKNSAGTLGLNVLRTAAARLERAVARGEEAGETTLLLEHFETTAEQALVILEEEVRHGAHSDH